MKFGIFVMPQQPRSDDPVVRFREVVEQVRLARDAGFDVMAAGHHYLSPPSSRCRACRSCRGCGRGAGHGFVLLGAAAGDAEPGADR